MSDSESPRSNGSSRGPLRVAIVGGGITGLSCAYYLQQLVPEAHVGVFEERARWGGNIVTEQREGFLLDGGPDSFLRTKPEALTLCRELGLEPQLISTRPEARNVYLVHRGKLELLPAGMVLGVPTQLRPLIKTPILSIRGKLRMLLDLLQPPETTHHTNPTEHDESIAAFMGRHFGREAVERIGAPLLGAIFAGDVERLSVCATFPELVRFEAQYGSVLLGLLSAQSKRARSSAKISSRTQPGDRVHELWHWFKSDARKAPSPFVTLRDGLGTLVSALIKKLPPESRQAATGVRRVIPNPEGGGFVETDRERWAADAIVLATPAHVSARLLPEGELTRELREIPYASTVTLFFALRRGAIQRHLDGAGFLAAKGEAQIRGATWVSTKWEARAPEGCVLIRVYLGGDSSGVDVRELDDDALAKLGRRELERLIGPLGPSLFEQVFRHLDARPQPVVGHGARLARVATHLQAYPGLYLTGAAYLGSGIPDCIRQARATAERIARKRRLT